MTNPELTPKQQAYMQVYEEEIAHRRKYAEENAKDYPKYYSGNLKGLSKCCEEECVWVPMSILWIHNKVKKGYMLNGVKRRGFTEAFAYTADDRQIVPQMCWNCVATREHDVTWKGRQSLKDAIIADNKPKKRRPRKPKAAGAGVLSDFGSMLAV